MKINVAIGLMALLGLLGMHYLYNKELERVYQFNKEVIASYCWPFVPSKMLK